MTMLTDTAHLTDIYEDNWLLCCGQIIKGEGEKQKNLLGGYCHNLGKKRGDLKQRSSKSQ